MENSRVRRIALSGAAAGSAILRENGDKTRVRLSVRGGTEGMVLYTAGRGGVVGTPVSGDEITVPGTGICAAVLTRDGRLVAGGFSGDCAKDRNRLLSEIRIRAAGDAAEKPKAKEPKPASETLPSVQERKPKKQNETRTAYRPSAAVTGSIIERAEALFGFLEELTGESASAVPKEKTEEETGFRQIPNPFPRTYPNSVWRMREGDLRLFGELRGRGAGRRLIAVPADIRRGPNRAAPRLVTAKNGRKYLVGEAAGDEPFYV